MPLRETAPLDVAVTVAALAMATPASKAPEPAPVPLMATPPGPALTVEPPILTPMSSLLETGFVPPPEVPVRVTDPAPVAFTVALLLRKTP